MIYTPYGERTPDTQYRDRLELILKHGVQVRSQQNTDALRFIAPPPMRFRLANGFPIITERDIKGFWKQSVGEICAFINGARSLEELHSFGCFFWDRWATAEKCMKRGLSPGDLGLGSYGHSFENFTTRDPDKNGFNQIRHVVEQIRELPHLRTHFVSPWIPQFVARGQGKKQRVVVAPCHGWMHFLVDESRNELSLHMFQRSADFPVGVPSNMAQYAALLMMMAHVTGYAPGDFIHSFSDAHIYVDQIPAVEEMLGREARPFPTVEMASKPDLFDFRAGDFTLSDYMPHSAIKDIPVAI